MVKTILIIKRHLLFFTLMLSQVYSDCFQRPHEITILEQTEHKGRNENPAECGTVTFFSKFLGGKYLNFLLTGYINMQ